MALITTTASLVQQYNAFTGLSALERAQSGVARAEVVYYCVNEDWPGPGTGNRRLFQSGETTLPKDFGYVITDAYLQVKDEGSNTVAAGAVANLRILPGGVLGPQINTVLTSYPDRQDLNASTAIGSINANLYNPSYPSITGEDGEMTYVLRDKPNGIIYPFSSNSYTTAPNPGSSWNLAVGEAAANGTDYKVTMYVRFLQYDIDQSYNYPIQSPQLIR